MEDDKSLKNLTLYFDKIRESELIRKLSEIGQKYNCSAKEVILKLKEIKNKEAKDGRRR